MIRAEQIPDEVVEAYLLARSEGAFTPNELIAAAINAWPGMKPCVAFTGNQSKEWPDDYVEKHMGPAILLPLTENSK